MRILFLGDIVGRAAREAVIEMVPRWRRSWQLDAVVANGENAAAGFGITARIADRLFAAGIDVITTGNHVFDQKEALQFIEQTPRLLRPLNYPEGTPGRGVALVELGGGRRILVINAMGRVFMPALDCPFRAVDAVLNRHPLGRAADAIIVDIHAEATSEKMAMGQFCAGRASLVVGTHSHVPTADTMILADGTAYQTDAGMCGDYDSVIGMDKAEPIRRFLQGFPIGRRFEPALGEPTLCGVVIETDETGRTRRAAPLRVGGRLSPAIPDWLPPLPSADEQPAS